MILADRYQHPWFETVEMDTDYFVPKNEMKERVNFYTIIVRLA